MDKETARLLFMDYLYDELEADRRAELEEYLEQNPELRHELNELSNVRSMLTHLQTKEPAEQLVMMEPGTNPDLSRNTVRNSGNILSLNRFVKAALATAAMVLLFFSAGALTDLNFSIGNDGLKLAFGPQQEVQEGISPEQVQLMLDEVKRENAVLMADLLEASRQQQEEQFQRTLGTFADYINEQRYSDLQLLSSGISSLEETYYDRFRQTDQVLGEIIQTVSTQN